MSEKKVYHCDACGSELLGDYDPQPQRIYIPVGLESDPAGGSSTTDSRPIDLCQCCLAIAVNNFLQKRCSFGYNTEIFRVLISNKIFTLNIKGMDIEDKVAILSKK